MINIIGGSGFLGSYLIQELVKSENVLNIDKSPSPYFNKITKIGNILNKDQIKINANSKCIILLAAEHRDDVSPSSLYYDVNVYGTKNVLDKMDDLGIKNLIFTSSVAVYGLNKTNPNENHPKDPFNHYGKSKWRAELEIKKWYDKDPLNKSVTIIRPTVIFGEKNRGNVYNLLKQIISKRFLMIGSGKNKKSLAYVRNIVSFIKKCVDKNEFGYNVYNYADKPDLSMTELVSFIDNKMNLNLIKIQIPIFFGFLVGYFFDFLSFIFGKKFSISSVRIKKFTAKTQFDSSLALKKFKPPFTIKEGLKNTLNYEFNKNKIKDDVLFYSE